MEINANLPFDLIDLPDEFMRPEAVAEIGGVLEASLFAGANVTDHPAPTGRWLDAGGHYAQDPFVMLSMLAAHTSTLRLQTGILVLPYRNPFIVARAAATLDVFSGGRLTLGIGAGYLKGEYFAVGADFERRNDIMDEYMLAMKAAWTGEDFDFQGSNYSARGIRIRPRPLQQPHPPLLVGGNSKRAIRRAVDLGDGWYPFFAPGGVSATARTTEMSGEEDLIARIDYIRQYTEQSGRGNPPTIFTSSFPQAIIDRLGRFQELGIGGCATAIEGNTLQEWCDNARRYSEEVLSKLD